MQRSVVPCNFGQKEKYIQALQGDPKNDNKISIKLPQIAYDLMDITYDSTRKLQTTLQNYNVGPNGGTSQYMGVPWNLDFNIYIYVRNVEDGTQIIEQILPYFTPNYTLVVNLVPIMNLQANIPIVLNKANYEVLNEGEARDPTSRIIIWTLNFTAQAMIYGPTSSAGVIQEAIVGLYNWTGVSGQDVYLVTANGSGNYLTTETVYQGSSQEPTAYATVVDWSSLTNRLLVTDVSGMFYTNTPVVGVESGTSRYLVNYEIQPSELEQIVVTANSAVANAFVYGNTSNTIITYGTLVANANIGYVPIYTVEQDLSY